MDITNGARPIPSTGLTVVCSSERPNLDVVFVHGFTGHPVRTWTHKKGDISQDYRDDVEMLEPPSKLQKLGLFSKSQQRNIHQSMYWPQELIPKTLPNARVLTYGYDTNIRHRLGPPGSTSTVYDIAWDFLVALETIRRVEPLRPVLFIAHSLGGIVVKEMLRRSSDHYQSQTHLRHVFTSTIGVMFFGTPHSGADPRNFLHRIAEKIIKAAGFSVNEQVVSSLLPSAERLTELRDEFGPRAQQRNWVIHSFQEQVGVPLLGGAKVVEDWSSTLYLPGSETKEHIGRNHMDMCRFTGPDDAEYKKVAAALHKMTESITKQPMEEQNPELSGENRKLLLESLRFDQIDSRQMTIKKAHARTCKWLLGDSKYLDWLDPGKLREHHGFLWIKGKPGTGKSTLLKVLLANSRKSMKESIVISFFFNARGEQLEKSTLGTYQSLLLQLLERIPTLESVFESLDLSVNGIHANYQWSVESLKALLEEAISRLGNTSVICIIDALDECDEREIRDMTSFFEHIGEGAVSSDIRFLVCFSSRHYPHISMQRGLELILEGQEGHTEDITRYLESELKIGQSKIAKQIRTDLQEKASGVFLWVVLVVEILNKEHDSGRIHALRRRLQEIPGDLHELFRDVLTRDSRNQDELILCLQWVLFAKHPLTPEELYYAVLSGGDPEDLSSWDPDSISIPDMKRFILDASKGLTETTASKNPKCQFIHESVKDFLLKEHGLARIWPDLNNDFQGRSHERLKDCCVNYMKVGGATYLDLPLSKASSEKATTLRKSVTEAYPFMDYAVHQLFFHADVAQGSDIAQGSFMQSLNLPDWIQLNNLFEKHQNRRYTPNASLLYILAEFDASNLISVHPSVLTFLDVENERYGFPLLASLATGSEKAVLAFVKAMSTSQPSDSQLQELCNQYCGKGEKKTKVGRGLAFSNYGSVLSSIAAMGDEKLFAIVLATRKFDLHSRAKSERTPLWHAAKVGQAAIVRLLVEEGVDPNTKTKNNGQTILSQMTYQGLEVGVQTLLELEEVDVNSKDENGQTPLGHAIFGGHDVIVRILLNAGKIDVNSSCSSSDSTPLEMAMTQGFQSIAIMLLDTGKVNINSEHSSGNELLMMAIVKGQNIIVKMLLDTEQVDVTLKDSSGASSLIRAAKGGNLSVVQILLDTGKIDVNWKTEKGETALAAAIEGGSEAIVKLLLHKSNIDVDPRDFLGRTPLLNAARDGKSDLVRLLLDTGKVEVDVRDRHGHTPLLCAARHGSSAVVSLLLETGKVNVNVWDCHGQTPLWCAANRKRLAVAKLLLETGKLDFDVRDSNVQRVLWCAARYGRLNLVKLLLETGKVDVNLIDTDTGGSPRSIAARYSHQDILDMMDEYSVTESYWKR